MIARHKPISVLFRLPRELQELITEFFARWETMPLLTVNKAFHELFAERIWRRLNRGVPYKVSIPPEALKTYGHLVRRFNKYQNVPVSDDLLSTFPNLTHLWIPFYELKKVVLAAQGKPLERLQHLGFSSYDERGDIPETTVNHNPAIKWLNRQIDNCNGKLTIEWETYGAFDLQYSPKLVSWLKSQSEKAHICFTIESDVFDLGDASCADTNNLLISHLIELGIGTGDEKCGAAGVDKVLASIPLNERKGLKFPMLKKLTLPVCCDSGSKACSQFDFGSLFPAVQELNLKSNDYQCTEGADKLFKAIFANLWPSMRKLVVEGSFFLDRVVPHLSSLPNVEHLTMHSTPGSNEADEIDLRDIGDALPKLTYLDIGSFSGFGCLKEMPRKGTGNTAALKSSPFPCLRSIILGRIEVEPYAMWLVTQAPVLTAVHLLEVYFADYDWRKPSYGIRRFTGVKSSKVRSLKFVVDGYVEPEEYETAFKVLLKCFACLKVCETVNVIEEVLDEYRSKFPTVTFVKSSN